MSYLFAALLDSQLACFSECDRHLHLALIQRLQTAPMRPNSVFEYLVQRLNK